MAKKTTRTPFIVFAMLPLIVGMPALASCAHATGTSAIILNDRLEVVMEIPGPPSIAVTKMPGESTFTLLSARGQVQSMRNDGASVAQPWKIPTPEKFEVFSGDGRFTVTTSGDEVIWRNTTDGEVAGRIDLAQPRSVYIGVSVGVALSNGQMWTFHMDDGDAASPRARAAGTLVALSGNEQFVSVGAPETPILDHYDIYSIDGRELVSFSDVRTAAWLDAETFAMLGSREYCEWNSSEGTACLWDKGLEYNRISADVRPESLLLWSRFSRVLSRYLRSNGQELQQIIVPLHLDISGVEPMGDQIIMITDQSV